MNFEPVRPARIDFGDPHAPRSPLFDDLYHARGGALAQARHVFLHGNGLPGRWGGRSRFVVLETGFGLGGNFLTTWQAWRNDPSRCEHLWFVSVEKHPPLREDLLRAHRDSPLRDLAAQLLAAWPPATPDFHRLDFEAGRVHLLLLFADVARALPELVARVDAVYLDGFAPDRNPAMWDARTLRHLNRLAAEGATVATWSVAGAVQAALRQAGFAVAKVPGFAAKREMTVGRFEPRHLASAPPGRRAGARGPVAIVGGALAGGALGCALAAQAVPCTVFDERPAIPADAAGGFGGLFHGVVHRDDTPHARWLRAGALRARQAYSPLVEAGRVPGHAGGLLRRESRLDHDAMRRLLDAQALPADWVQAWSADDAAAASATAASSPAWFYPGGGWLAPVELIRHWQRTDGVALRGETRVDRLRRCDAGWELLDASGRVIDRAATVVLANASDAVRLLGAAPGAWQRTRGQVSLWRGGHPPLPIPIADRGYALQLPDGTLAFGATSTPDDDDPRPRDADHDLNLATLARLTGWPLPPDAAGALDARVGWRLQTADRLPWIGPAPDRDHAAALRDEQPRFVARREGLWVLAGLGSRGLTHAPLAGELLASWITGAPLPVPASLVDAVDVARFAARERRAAGACPPPFSRS